MRRSEDFRRTVRHGVRAGRRTLVVHALRVGNDDERHGVGAGSKDQSTGSPLVGFVVSRSVGSAVRRNRVRRRLRHLILPHLGTLDDRTLVVVRALPPAGTDDARLGPDLEAAWEGAVRKLTGADRRDRR
jgi:ribonuclease P protein component